LKEHHNKELADIEQTVLLLKKELVDIIVNRMFKRDLQNKVLPK